ncbi:hypothetical protein FTX45_13345 [Leclercia adecarboxylata]|uniref:hypothetical protein n=2 Tax=Leclercia adecarboxylata TaxID=83655 RepID=UPI0012478EC1|nr:hypothetical protein [Leclercia adecarboxylata]QEY55749.1 hypothetical protein FTX45_13345 [Leclercia adecarboxylata]
MTNSAALYIRRAKGNGERQGMSAIERVEVKTNRHAVRDGKFFFRNLHWYVPTVFNFMMLKATLFPAGCWPLLNITLQVLGSDRMPCRLFSGYSRSWLRRFISYAANI